jgi:hypothetical protein
MPHLRDQARALAEQHMGSGYGGILRRLRRQRVPYDGAEACPVHVDRLLGDLPLRRGPPERFTGRSGWAAWRRLPVATIDGRHVALHDLIERATLVIMWNPPLRVLQRMLPSLHALDAESQERAQRLLVVSADSADEDLAMSLRAPVVLDDRFAAGPRLRCPRDTVGWGGRCRPEDRLGRSPSERSTSWSSRGESRSSPKTCRRPRSSPPGPPIARRPWTATVGHHAPVNLGTYLLPRPVPEPSTPQSTREGPERALWALSRSKNTSSR